MPFVLALDQGTTSSRAILFDEEGRMVAGAQAEFAQHFPRPGWVEHDPDEIWSSQIAVAEQVLSETGSSTRDVIAAGIANQRETTLIWDRKTGHPLHNAIVWQDRRTAPVCEALEAAGHEPRVQEKTGLVIDPYFCATKIAWVLENVAGARERAGRGELAFGTVDSWLIWKLTGGRLHMTDVTNASRTLLYDIHRQEWDGELLELFDIPAALLPEVRSCSEVYAPITTPALRDIPIAAAAGDQQAALFGQCCFDAGTTKNTYGTGCFALMNTGPLPAASRNRLLSTTAWRIADRTDFALEGSIFTGGAIVQWLRDGLGLIRSAPEIEALAATVPDNGGVYLVPALTGLGAPHWDSGARGQIMGLTRGATRGHIARAALEGIAFQVADVLAAMERDSGLELPELRADGGAAANHLLLQFQADVLGKPVLVPAVTESTALGAAYLAGLATGFWAATDDLRAQASIQRRFDPRMSRDEAEARQRRWAEAVNRTRGWDAGN